jgi:deoxycytidine triphosphate deaminase
VLLCDRIERLVVDGWLIVDNTYLDGQLKRAKYNVRLGDEYYQDGKYCKLDDDHPLLVIKPYELVFVESYEIFHLPKNVVAKYDLRIKGCLSGLGLQTGLQIDPEYYGRFFCPLFNFSDTSVILKYKDDLASANFIYTTPSTPEAERRPSFDRRNHLVHLSDALLDVPRVSGLEKLRSEIQEARQEMQNVNRVFLAVVGLAVAVIGAVQIPQAIGRVVQGTTPWWAMLIIGIVFLVIVCVIFAFIFLPVREIINRIFMRKK